MRIRKVFYGLIVVSIFSVASIALGCERVRSSTDDIFIQGIFNQSAQDVLFAQTRIALKNRLGYDPFQRELVEDLHYEAQLHTKMKEFVQSIVQGLILADINQSKMIVDIHGLSYVIGNAGLHLHAQNAEDSRVLKMNIETDPQDVTVRAKEVVIRFSTPTRSPLNSIVLHLKEVQFYSEHLNSLSLSIPSNIEVNDETGNAHFSFDDSFQNIFEHVSAEELQQDISLNVEHATIEGGLELQVGNVAMPVSEEDLLNAIQVRKKYISLLVLRPVANILGSLPDVISKKIFKGKSDLMLQTKVSLDLIKQTIEMNMDGIEAVGTDQLRIGYDLTLNHTIKKCGSSQSVEDYKKSTEFIEGLIAKGAYDLAISIGEGSLSELSTVLVQNMLASTKSDKLRLGQENVQFHFDDKSLGKIVVDLIVDAGWAAKPLLGKRKIRVPIVIDPYIGVEYKNLVPYLVLKAASIHIDEKTLAEGAYGIDSDIGKIRLKKLVLKKLRKTIADKSSVLKIEQPLAVFSGNRLDFIEVKSDGYGRLNILISLDPEKRDSIRDFWAKLIQLLPI